MSAPISPYLSSSPISVSYILSFLLLYHSCQSLFPFNLYLSLISSHFPFLPTSLLLPFLSIIIFPFCSSIILVSHSLQPLFIPYIMPVLISPLSVYLSYSSLSPRYLCSSPHHAIPSSLPSPFLSHSCELSNVDG